MSPRPPREGRRGRHTVAHRRALAVSLPVAAAAGALVLLAGGAASRGAGAGGEPIPQTDASVPAAHVSMIGATAEEAGAPGSEEVWGLGTGAAGAQLVRWSRDASGAGRWVLGPQLLDSGGGALSGFVLDTPETIGTESAPSPLAGQMTANGAGVLLGEAAHRQVALVRDPTGGSSPFREVPAPSLQAGEALFSATRAPLVAPLDEGGSHAGALLVPIKERNFGIEESVLRWDGTGRRWVREAIELPSSASPTEFRVLGIGATSPANAWLAAQLSEGQIALFHRVASGEEATWKAVPARAGGEAGEALSVDGEALDVPGAHAETLRSQVVTVTRQGVWVDAERPGAHASTTVFYSPAEGGSGPSLTSWCTLEASPPGTAECDHPLPQALPTGASRSIAWAGGEGAAYGERVITGLAEGVSLRLEGSSFRRVRTLGGAAGGAYGAAFVSPREGWLGARLLAVHLTLRPAPNNLTPWPVSFRRPLLAAAPAPGQQAGAISSEAIAVGDLGEVARYVPGEGWLPEALLGSGGRRQTPRLRAVAWPTPGRAYAVGAEGAMWLWRGEVGRWEADPAAPYAFEGNLLGVAFAPGDPSRGYAVGQDGLLLAFGKSWTQDALPAESPCPAEVSSPRCTWSLASFTSVAFAGSEAIAAYRLLPDTASDRYVGGVIVNTGSGWHLDPELQAALAGRVPWAVAGLPDGGAAVAAETSIIEREAPGAPWRRTATPYPGQTGPGSLGLFREGGSLRVVASGSVPDTYPVDRAPEAPPGSPPTKIAAYPLATSSTAAVLAQVGDSWRDEQHTLIDAAEPAGNWSQWDVPGEPDPIAAVVVDPTSGQGWAVGGVAESEEHEGLLDTADVARLGSGGGAPVGAGTYQVPVSTSLATFAVGGNAQCAAPCADRSATGIGPDVWLRSALGHADLPGVRAFLYTGPRVVDRHAITGPEVSADHFSYEREHEQLGSILRSSPLPAFAAIGSTDLDEGETAQSFERALMPGPLGGEEAARAQISPLSRPTICGGAAGCAYYAFTSSGPAGAVRVIVLDDSLGAQEPGPEQRHWLAGQLLTAAALQEPAVVVGQADLAAQQAAGNHPGASEVVRILAQDGASAYFFDSPEQNIKELLRSGSATVEAFGTGTLGYVSYQGEKGGAFLGSSGFLLAQVDVAHRDKRTNVAHVTARLIPNIGELALEARAGTLLRRSQVASFAGLARRPRAGNRSASRGAVRPETDPYIPLPAECTGAACAAALLPEASFSSSRPEVGDFVARNAASSEPDAVLVGANGKPVHDSTSGLFCAYNAGTTTVTITAGGLSASLLVTVQPGSVGQPCGSVPITSTATPQSPQPAPAPTPLGTALNSAAPIPPPVPLASPPTPVPPAHPAPPLPPAPLPFLLTAAIPPPLSIAVPPPPAPAAEPTPPSGTSPVSSTAPEKEQEDEEATEHSSAAVAYRPHEDEPLGMYLLGLVVLAALAGAGARVGRGRREVQVAPVTLNAMRNQRRLDAASRPRRR